MVKIKSVEFFVGVVLDNYKEHIGQIVMAIGVPIAAYILDQFTPWLLVLSGWLLVTTWMSMLRQDIADHYRAHIFSMECAFAEMMQEKFQNVMKEKIESGISGVEMELSIDKDGKVNVK